MYTVKQCKKCWCDFIPSHYKQEQCHECLWHPCPVCWWPRIRLTTECCSKKCAAHLKSTKAKEWRIIKYKDRLCPICWKHIDSIKTNRETCWSWECRFKLAKQKELIKNKILLCKRCGKEFISVNNNKYCEYCQHWRSCPICWKKIKRWRDDTCSRKCSNIYKQQLYWELYKEYAKKMHTEEAKKKAAIWRKWRPNIKNRWPHYKLRWENNPWRKWWWTTKWRRWYMQSKEYKRLIKEVYERDNFTCQICHKVWWMLNCHHIRTYDYYPELRYDKNNLITLCEECHKMCHSKWHWTHWAKETFSILCNMYYGL